MTSPDRPLDIAAVTAWIDEDPSAADRAALCELLRGHEQGNPEATAALHDAFDRPLSFGTAGLRGPLGPGPARMNRAVVVRTTAGLCAYLRREIGEDFVVVVGHDARHGSEGFARDTAAVVTGAGGRALLFDGACPTPVVAFALRRLRADAAVVVTASHNPAGDNGYKIYLGGRAATGPGQGAQIAPPEDAAVAACVDAVGRTDEVPLATSGWRTLGAETVEEYNEHAARAARMRAAAPLRIVLTALHGVGGSICRDALGRAGFDDVVVVEEQFAPDPDFPTLALPNPEEPDSLDMAVALAREVDADLVLANDPDADRCAAAIPDEHAALGWRRLTGDEVGALLGEQAAELAAFAGTGVLANSIVSSRLLRRIAQVHGLGHRNALTGFKWICRVPGLVFGYEEAMGYCVDPASVRDKDGISASVRLALLASVLKQQGRTVADLLDRLAREHGLYATDRIEVATPDPDAVSATMERLRAGGVPASLAGSPVADVFDLMDGASDGNGGRLPATDGLIVKTAADDRVVVRPSGTEPKLKCYCEVVVPVAVDEPVEVARRTAAERLESVRADLRGALGA